MIMRKIEKVELYDVLVDRYIAAQARLKETPEYKKVFEASDNLVSAIKQNIANAKSVEALIEQERELQETDLTLASTKEERNAIKNAMTDYQSLLVVVGQMRRSPEEYLTSNAGQKDNRMSFEKQPHDKGLAQIEGNVMRCKNRALHSTDDMRQVWEARILLALETKGALKKLHNSLAENHAQKLRMREEGELKRGTES